VEEITCCKSGQGRSAFGSKDFARLENSNGALPEFGDEVVARADTQSHDGKRGILERI